MSQYVPSHEVEVTHPVVNPSSVSNDRTAQTCNECCCDRYNRQLFVGPIIFSAVTILLCLLVVVPVSFETTQGPSFLIFLWLKGAKLESRSGINWRPARLQLYKSSKWVDVSISTAMWQWCGITSRSYVSPKRSYDIYFTALDIYCRMCEFTGNKSSARYRW